jgi:hypothetical protein
MATSSWHLDAPGQSALRLRDGSRFRAGMPGRAILCRKVDLRLWRAGSSLLWLRQTARDLFGELLDAERAP